MANAKSDEPNLTANEQFRNPHSLANRVGRVVWNIVFLIAFRPTPARMAGGWRRWLLRLFGARIGKSWLHPSVRIWAPWLLEIGDEVYVDRGCQLYNPYGIRIEDRVIISFESVLCTASHDYTDPAYTLTGGSITVESDTWIMAQVFVCPGRVLGRGSVVAARSVVTRDVERMTVVGGNPARFLKVREVRDSSR